jgi:type II secretory pathway component GspD/PulD (secretin)
MAGALIAGTVTAQEKSESVDSILKELGSYQGKTTAPAAKPAEVVPAKAPAPVVAPAPVIAKPAVKAETKAPAAKPEVAVKAEKPAAKESKGWMFWRSDDAKDAVAAKADKPAEKPAVKAETKAPAAKPEVAVKAEQPADKPVAKADEKPAKVDVPDAVVAALDVPKTLEASRELYAGGEFEQAQKGFEAVIKKEPENVIARMYLRKLLERDPRTAEVQGMNAVNNGWKTDLVLRSYAISADAAAKMGLEKATESTDVAMKFPEVKFPKGSSAVYQPKAEKLFVRNTRENLLVLEEILSAMDVAKLSSGVEQVEIEAKFVEVSEGTLEELGFEWRTTLGNIGGKGVTLSDKIYAPEGQYLFDDALRGGASGPAMPFVRPGSLSQAEVAAGAGEWKAFRFEDTFNAAPASMRVSKAGSTPLDILISALDQSTGTDVLSAPRVVTQSGKKATIRAGELHYFPETYEVGGNAGTIIHVKYVDFAEKLLGVELDVNPKVDGDQISLSLNPKVSELLGWQTYQIAPRNSAYNYFQYGISQQFNHDPITARLPIFKRREIKTEVTIADGATMGMGGLINEKVEKYEDKVPVLGSIPLIGRLFRNEGERAVKRNLLIFVTAKKVDPNGRINTARSFE